MKQRTFVQLSTGRSDGDIEHVLLMTAHPGNCEAGAFEQGPREQA